MRSRSSILVTTVLAHSSRVFSGGSIGALANFSKGRKVCWHTSHGAFTSALCFRMMYLSLVAVSKEFASAI